MRRRSSISDVMRYVMRYVMRPDAARKYILPTGLSTRRERGASLCVTRPPRYLCMYNFPKEVQWERRVGCIRRLPALSAPCSGTVTQTRMDWQIAPPYPVPSGLASARIDERWQRHIALQPCSPAAVLSIFVSLQRYIHGPQTHELIKRAYVCVYAHC